MPRLTRVERQAATMFEDYLAATGLSDELLEQVTSIEVVEEAADAGRLWVVQPGSGAPVGFGLVSDVAGYAHLVELSVLPSHARQGLGSRLLEAAVDWAVRHECPGVTLFTFRDIPWNAPFYARRGFREVEPSRVSAEHQRLRISEAERGLRPDRRMLMLRSVRG